MAPKNENGATGLTRWIGSNNFKIAVAVIFCFSGGAAKDNIWPHGDYVKASDIVEIKSLLTIHTASLESVKRQCDQTDADVRGLSQRIDGIFERRKNYNSSAPTNSLDITPLRAEVLMSKGN